MDEKQWERMYRETWDEAAAELEAQGYERHTDDTYFPVIFRKGDHEVILSRHLGKMDWHPRERQHKPQASRCGENERRG